MRSAAPPGAFNVWQFFSDGSPELVAWRVGAEAAVRRVKSLTESIGALLGTTIRIIITDAGDCTAFDWRHGDGVVFPTRADLAKHRAEAALKPAAGKT